MVGEDLGTVPPAVRRAMRRHALVGSWVAQGALEDVSVRGDFTRPRRRTVASLNTHDMPTFAGFVEGSDVNDRAALGQIDAATAVAQHRRPRPDDRVDRRAVGRPGHAALLDGLLEDMGRSPAEIVLVNLEDLWLEARPHNVPGTSTERPNWRRPAAIGSSELDDASDARATLARLAHARNGAGPVGKQS